MKSKLPQAKEFKRWVTSEVLPTIRKHVDEDDKLKYRFGTSGQDNSKAFGDLEHTRGDPTDTEIGDMAFFKDKAVKLSMNTVKALRNETRGYFNTVGKV